MLGPINSNDNKADNDDRQKMVFNGNTKPDSSIDIRKILSVFFSQVF